MKILYVTTISNTLNAFLIPHIRMLLDEGHQVSVACSLQQPLNSFFYENNIAIHNIPFDRSPLSKINGVAYKKFKTLIENEKFDIVHTHTPVASMIVRIACRKKAIKIFYTAHGFHFFKGAALKNWLIYYPVEKFLLKYTDVLITMNSEDFQRANKMRGKSSKVRIEHTNGVGIEFEWNKLTDYKKLKLIDNYNLREAKIITCVAELSVRKNQIELIRAFKELKNKYYQNCKLLLIGSGNLRDELESYVKEIGLSKDVIFTGFQNNVNDYLQISDVLVSASKQEGLPVNIMEAMNQQLPIVASSVRGHRDLLMDYPKGSLYEIGDIADFCKKISVSLSKDWKDTEFNLYKYSVKAVVNQLRYIYNLEIAVEKKEKH